LVEGDEGKRTPERLRKVKTKELAQIIVWAAKGRAERVGRYGFQVKKRRWMVGRSVT
jgi:hypothetical protein